MNRARDDGWFDELGQAVRFVFASQVVGEGESVVDVGCGQGALVSYLPRSVVYTGIDREPPPTASNERITYLTLDYMTDDIPSGDVVFAIGSLIGEGNDVSRFLSQIKSSANKSYVVIAANEHAPVGLQLDPMYVPLPSELGSEFSRFESVLSNAAFPRSPISCLEELLDGRFAGWDPVGVSHAYWMFGENERALDAISGLESERADVMRQRVIAS